MRIFRRQIYASASPLRKTAVSWLTSSAQFHLLLEAINEGNFEASSCSQDEAIQRPT